MKDLVSTVKTQIRVYTATNILQLIMWLCTKIYYNCRFTGNKDCVLALCETANFCQITRALNLIFTQLIFYLFDCYVFKKNTTNKVLFDNSLNTARMFPAI